MSSDRDTEPYAGMIRKQSCPRRISFETPDRTAESIEGIRKIAHRIKGVDHEAKRTEHGESERHGTRDAPTKLALLTLEPERWPSVYLERADYHLDRLQKIEVVRDTSNDVYQFLLAFNNRLGLTFEEEQRSGWSTGTRRASRSGPGLFVSDHPSWFKVECEDCERGSCWHSIRPWTQSEGASSTDTQCAVALDKVEGEWNVSPLKDEVLPPPYPVHLAWRPCDQKPCTWCFMRI